MKKYLPYFSGVTTAGIFGFSFLFSKNALDSLNTFELLFMRFLMAVIAMTLLILIGIIKVNYRGKNIKLLIAVALWQPVLYFIMETWGLKYTTSSEAGVMMAFIPILVTILAGVFLNEKPTKLQSLFILMSVLGVVMIVLMGNETKTGGQLKGIIFLIIAVFSAAMFNIFSRRASRNFTPIEITYFMMCLGLLVFGGVFFINGLRGGNLNLIPKMGREVWISIFYLGVVSSVIAFLLTNYNLSKLKASQSAVFANLTTVVSVVAGITIRHEPFSLEKVFGTVMIILGVWGTNYFAKNK